MSANPDTAAPTGRKKAIGHRSSTIGDPAQPPAALSHASQNTSSPEGVKEGGELPNGWRWVTLREIADIAGGVTKGQKRRPNETVRRVPYLRVANVQRGYLDLTEVKEIDASETEIESLRLRAGDILFNEGGDRDKLGRGWIWNGELPECVHQNHVFRARVRDSADSSKFISYYGNSAGQRYFYDQGKHTTNLASINLTKLGALPIPLPSPDEQRRIVAEIEKQFTRMEAGVAALRRVQANLKRYRAAVLKAASEGRLVPTEAELHRKQNSKTAKFETGAELLARILAERRQNWLARRSLGEGGQGRGQYKEPAAPDTANLPPLPDGWTYASVESVGFVQLGRQRAPQHHKGANMRPYLRVANVFEDRIDLSDVMEMNFTPDEFETFQLKPNDILLNEGQSLELVGRPAIYKDELPGACFTNTLVRFRPCRALDVRFALCVFRAFMHSGRFQKIAKWTTNIAHLGSDRFAKMAFPLPPLAEQTRIVAEVERRLSVVEELESVVSANLQRASSLRQSILKKAFTGELV